MGDVPAVPAMWEVLWCTHKVPCKQCGRMCTKWEVHTASKVPCNVGGTQSAMWEVLWVGVSPAEINQRVSGRLAGLQSCNCLFFANIVILILIVVIIIIILIVTTVIITVIIVITIIRH